MLNNKIKTLLFQFSAILILFAAIYYQFDPSNARWVMIVGAIGYTLTCLTNRYEGGNVKGKRLFSKQLFSVILIAISAYLMFVGLKGWIVTLLFAAILMLYYVFTMSKIEKEDEGNNK